MNNVNKKRSKYSQEVAPKTGTLHAHITVQIEHNTDIKLDFKKISSDMGEKLGLSNVYIKNYMFKNNEGNIRDYINKYINN